MVSLHSKGEHMSSRRSIFGKAAALTAIISAATGLFWAAIAWFNKKAEEKASDKVVDTKENCACDTADEADNQ